MKLYSLSPPPFIYRLLLVVSVCFLSGCSCFAKAEMELECLPKLVYTINKNELNIRKMGTIERAEANAAVFKANLETARLAFIWSYKLRKKPKISQPPSTLMLLGPYLHYYNGGLITNRKYIYVQIDGEKTWIPIKALSTIVAYHQTEQNLNNNLKLKISSKKGGWSSGGWECPIS